ncbi:MAG: 2-amino-4-hydroxy-6-hydroxymethyldihydropteridine diphosphokinase [Bacteriovoracaceae bacterium]
MSLIIATGSNQGNSQHFLNEAKKKLCQHFNLIAESRVYHSRAVDYEDQPDFLNQLLEFNLPALLPEDVLKILLKIEKDMGRIRNIPKGPRTIDIDIVFWGCEKFDSDILTIPHPRWFERAFIVKPLHELPYFRVLQNHFSIPSNFSHDAMPIL